MRGAIARSGTDALIAEEPLEIRVAGPSQQPITVVITMRTPGHDEDLAAGFLLSEGLIEPDDVVGFALGDPGELAHPHNRVTVLVRAAVDPDRVAPRTFVATSSCGICGKASLEDLERRCRPVGPGPLVGREVLRGLPGTLRAAQALFEQTGALHACGLFDESGRLQAAREDVGRHNALDKLIGHARTEGLLPLSDRIVLVSGRVAFEIVQKAAMAGVGMLAAVSAPTDLAVRTADRLGLTLIGFLRDDGFNVYTHPQRIADLPAELH